MGMRQIGSKKSLSEQAYEVLKEAIITGELRPGQILIEEQLANQLVISRTPVRSAVRRLEADNLVEITPSKNIVVASISEKEIQDASQARQLVEVEAVGILAETITEEQCGELEAIIQRQKDAMTRKEYLEFMEYEYQFHVKIGEFCGNIWYGKMLESISLLQRRVLILTWHLEKDWDYVIDEHTQILEALRSHDKEKSRKAMQFHIINTPMELKNQK
ncbi:MAG: GntR family transcriptional regulator [Faecalicatena sp.]|uniref:GntR family transcriptional regulator n=1 Tax=Faecalicatena sp. TaxID=2005360 RepID=UPI002590EF3B|nr:GntR family transcriptional regulator [Faecalicatena sp.]MCI6467960.1 GntR family transcriptional regulator [Faecalicatena sp.]MDY5619398.1 GntR family transcriptional regulator [Lachnospiraceae bacterium]